MAWQGPVKKQRSHCSINWRKVTVDAEGQQAAASETPKLQQMTMYTSLSIFLMGERVFLFSRTAKG